MTRKSSPEGISPGQSGSEARSTELLRERPVGRRQLMLGTAGAAVGATFLGACSTTSTSGNNPAGEAVKPPTYVPYTGVKPDLPADEKLDVPAGYFHYPADPATFVEGEIGKGGEIQMLLQASSISVPEDRNQRWQALNKAMNVKMKFSIATSADYLNKLQVTLAGGQLPDVAQIIPVPQLPNVLKTGFADLSEYLSGDAIKDYPGLAAIPSYAWRLPTVNGKIYGVPQTRAVAGLICSTRQDVLDKLGITPQVNSGQDFVDLCKELRSKKGNIWAFGSLPPNWVMPYVMEMMGAPNQWREEGGKFTSIYESDRVEDALEVVRKLWADDLIHPDSFSKPASNINWWKAGTTILYFQDFAGWPSYTKQFPEMKFGVVPAMKWEGGGLAAKRVGPGAYYAFTAFKKASEDRIKELLRLANYVAAPFGTKEHLLANYGVADVDYKLNGPDPVTTETGTAEALPLGYVSSTSFVNLYVAGNTDSVKAQHEYLTKVMANVNPDPTVGLYSETFQTAGAIEQKRLLDLQGEIIQGRRKVSDWAPAVDEWRTKVGDKARSEFAQAFEASQ